MGRQVNVEQVVIQNKDDRNMVTTTQLRLLLSNSVVVKNKIEMVCKKGDKLPAEIQNEIKYLLIKHIYQCGRDAKVRDFDKAFHIADVIKDIGDSQEKFNEYYRYLEEIVAYVKYYKG